MDIHWQHILCFSHLNHNIVFVPKVLLGQVKRIITSPIYDYRKYMFRRWFYQNDNVNLAKGKKKLKCDIQIIHTVYVSCKQRRMCKKETFPKSAVERIDTTRLFSVKTLQYLLFTAIGLTLEHKKYYIN